MPGRKKNVGNRVHLLDSYRQNPRQFEQFLNENIESVRKLEALRKAAEEATIKSNDARTDETNVSLSSVTPKKDTKKVAIIGDDTKEQKPSTGNGTTKKQTPKKEPAKKESIFNFADSKWNYFKNNSNVTTDFTQFDNADKKNNIAQPTNEETFGVTPSKNIKSTTSNTSDYFRNGLPAPEKKKTVEETERELLEKYFPKPNNFGKNKYGLAPIFRLTKEEWEDGSVRYKAIPTYYTGEIGKERAIYTDVITGEEFDEGTLEGSAAIKEGQKRLDHTFPDKKGLLEQLDNLISEVRTKYNNYGGDHANVINMSMKDRKGLHETRERLENLEQARAKLVWQMNDSYGLNNAIQSEYGRLSKYVRTDEEKARFVAHDSYNYSIGAPIKQGEEENYDAVENLLIDVNHTFDAAKEYANGRGYFGGLAAGFADKTFDTRTWTFGLEDLLNNRVINSVLNKADRGIKLSTSEEAVLDAFVLKTYTDGLYSGSLGYGYQAGATTGESLPFMVEMMINPLSRLGTKASKKIVSALGKHYLKNTTSETAIKATTTASIKAAMTNAPVLTKVAMGATRVGADLVASSGMSATSGLAGTFSDALERERGTLNAPEIELNEEGEFSKFKYAGRYDKKDSSTALYEAFAARTIENASEMWGEYFGPIMKPLKSGARTVLKSAHVNWAADLLSKNPKGKFSKLIKQFGDKSQFHGFVGEFMEEMAGGTANALVVGDQSLSDVWNWENIKETANGLWVTSAFFGGMSAVGYRTPKYRNRKEMESADAIGKIMFGGNSVWDEIRDKIKFGNEEEVLNTMLDVLSNNGITQNQKRAFVDYVQKAQRYKGSVYADNVLNGYGLEIENPLNQKKDKRSYDQIERLNKRGDWVAFRYAKKFEDAFGEGYNLTQHGKIRNIRKTLAESTKSAINMGISQDELDLIAEDPQTHFDEIVQKHNLTTSQKQSLVDYVSSRARYDGVIQRYADDIAEQTNEAKRNLADTVNISDGMIHDITFNLNGVPTNGTIVSGKVHTLAYSDDIDTQNSDNEVLVRDVDNRDLHVVKISDVQRLGSVYSPDPISDDIDRQAEEMRKQAVNEINDVLQFKENDVYTTTDSEGNEHKITILQNINEDEVLVRIDDQQEPVMMSKEEIQRVYSAETDNTNVEDQIDLSSTVQNVEEGKPIKQERTKDGKRVLQKVDKKISRNQFSGGAAVSYSIDQYDTEGNHTQNKYNYFNSPDVSIQEGEIPEDFDGKFLGYNGIRTYSESDGTTIAFGTAVFETKDGLITKQVNLDIRKGANVADLRITTEAPTKVTNGELEEKKKKPYVAPKVSPILRPSSNGESIPPTQEDALKHLQLVIDNNQKAVQDSKGNVRVTPHDYFITVNGKLKMFSRTHSIIGDQYEPLQENRNKANDLYKELNRIYESEGLKAYEKRIKEELVGEYNETIAIPTMDGGSRQVRAKRVTKDEIKVGDTIAYNLSDGSSQVMTDYGDVTTVGAVVMENGKPFYPIAVEWFDGKRSLLPVDNNEVYYKIDTSDKQQDDKETTEENSYKLYIQYIEENPEDYKKVSEAVASIVHFRAKGPSLTAGSEIDNICRDFFGKNPSLSYDKYSKYLTKEHYDELIKQLEDIRHHLEDELHWKLCTERTILYATLYDSFTGKEINVAGETDMIAVDQDGNYYILDFKTSKPKDGISGFADGRFKSLNPLWYKNQYGNWAKRVALHTTEEQYSRQTTMYKLMGEQSLLGSVKALMLVPFDVDYTYDKQTIDLVEGSLSAKSLELITLAPSNLILSTFANSNEQVEETRKRVEKLVTIADEDKIEIDKTGEDWNKLNYSTKAQIDKLNNDIDVWKNAMSHVANITSYDELMNQYEEIVGRSSALKLQIDNEINKVEQVAVENVQTVNTIQKQTFATTSELHEQQVIESKNKQEPFLEASDKVTSTFANGANSVSTSVATDDPSITFASVSGNSDFILNSKAVITFDGKNVQVTFTYGGHTFTPINVKVEKGKEHEFSSTVSKANIQAKKLGKVVAVSTSALSRTNGKFVNGTEGTLTDKGLVTAESLYSIEFSNEQSQFAEVRYRLVGNDVIAEAVKPGSTEQSYSMLHNYGPVDSSSNKPANGSIVMMVERPYNEVSGEKPKVPVNLHNANLSQGDVDLIADILTMKTAPGALSVVDALSKQCIIDGKNYGLTNKQVLDLLIPYGESSRKTNRLHVEIGDDLRIYIQGTANKQQPNPNGYDLKNPVELDQFKKFLLENVTQSVSNEILSCRLFAGSSKGYVNIRDALHPLYGLQQLLSTFKDDFMNGKEVRFGNSSIVFDRNDFVNPKDPANSNGLSGLAWYIKRGKLTTPFNGFENTLISIDTNVWLKIVDDYDPKTQFKSLDKVEKEEKQEIQDGIQAQADQPISNVTTDNTIDPEDLYSEGLPLRRKQKKESKNSRQTALENIERVLGENGVPVKFQSKFIEILAGGWFTVGVCKADAIRLSDLAEPGTEYHESFHRISEILMEDEERKRLYSAYRNALLKKGRKNLSDDEISELLAELFMFFSMNKPTIVLNHGIKQFFRSVIDWVKMFTKIGSFRLWKIYRDAYNGKFAQTLTEKQKERVKTREEKYKKEHPFGKRMQLRGKDIPFLANNSAYRELKDSINYILFYGLHIQDTGSNIDELSIEADDFKKAVRSCERSGWLKLNDENKALIDQLVESWDYIKEDIVASIKKNFADVRQTIEQEDAENKDSGDTTEMASTSQGEHTHASYEFSQFSRASQRVKFFFSRIPKSHWITVNKNGETKNIAAPTLNSFGLPTLVNSKTAFNKLLNLVYDCDTYESLFRILERESVNDTTYAYIYRRLRALYENRFNSVNDQSLLTLITRLLRANKGTFEVVKSEKDRSGKQHSVLHDSDASYTSRQYVQEWSKLFASGNSYIEMDDNGKYVMKQGKSPSVFKQFYMWIANRDPKQGVIGMILAFAPDQSDNKFVCPLKKGQDPVEVNADDEVQVSLIKSIFIKMLNEMGILFTVDEFNYMLRQKYKDSGAAGMRSFFEDQQYGGIVGFAKFVNTLYNPNTKRLNISPDGKVVIPIKDNKGNDTGYKEIDVSSIYDQNGFLKQIAKWKYSYSKNEDQLTLLTTNNNRNYTMSENNEVTDIKHEYNISSISGEDTEFIRNIKLFIYNYKKVKDPITLQDVAYGSALLKAMDKGLPITIVTLSGHKTDKPGDVGSDYTQIVEKEDVIDKIAALNDKCIVFPTMSDKKTYYVIRMSEGETSYSIISGIDYSMDAENFDTQEIPNVKINDDGSEELELADGVVSQLLEYATLEHETVQKVLKDSENLPDEQKVDNFHNGPTVKDKDDVAHTVIQGARYSTLTGVYTVDENGKEVFVSFNYALDANGNYVDEQQCIDIANDYFFMPMPGESEDDHIKRQKKMISRLMQDRVKNSLEYLESIGAIKKREGVTNDTPIHQKYENNAGAGLDDIQLGLLFDSLRRRAGRNLTPLEWKNLESTALYLYVVDVESKHVLSIQEVERLFAGHPAFFKYKYGTDGHFADRTTDLFKRFGGLISTGQNNDLQAICRYDELSGQWFDSRGKLIENPQDRYKYTCAEVDNEMVESSAIDSLGELMYEGELRNAYLQWLLDKDDINMQNSDDTSARELAKKADSIDLKEIEKEMSEDKRYGGNILLSLAKERAVKKKNAFRLSKEEKLEGIDVADGAAYISDEMAEDLLRMTGNYNEDVQKAFELLRDPSKVKSIREVADAYEKVWTSVIGSQKYTAYGFRFQNDVQVAYYNKMALFPMFKCMCTGRMAKLYDKMNKQGIKMLMVKSAVKLGGQGSKAINWDDFNDGSEGDTRPYFENDFQFNTYKQDYSYLRKQFNTDPKESDESSLGTLMTKVVMSAIVPGRQYAVSNSDGTTTVKSAKKLVSDVMHHIDAISDIGSLAIRDEFFTNDMLDIEKFSKILTEELIGRDASRELIDAVSTETVEATWNEELGAWFTPDGLTAEGHFVTRLKVPLVALSNMNFILSILVARVNKKVVEINSPGAPFIQRSVWGMEGPTKVQGDKNLPNDLNGGKKLLMVNEEGSMDCVLSIDFFDDLIPKIPKKDSDGNILYLKNKEGEYILNKDGERVPVMMRMPFEDARKYLIKQGIIGSSATANIIGSRIPTQAISSIHALRCVDVIPVVRDTVILPEEFTKITGSDFDIDKLYLSRMFYHKVGNKLSTKYKEGSREYHTNQLLCNYMSLLKDSKFDVDEDGNVKISGITRSMQKLHAPIDGDTQLLKDIDKDLYLQDSQKVVRPYEAYSMYTHTSTKTQFITGKFGIGPFALNNNNHILTMLFGVRFSYSKGSILSRLGANSLHNANDRYGQSIMSWISGLINAHVDVAKDPFIANLNVNKFTYNLINLMVRTGFGRDTFYFTTQPIMKELARVVNNAEGKYGQTEYSTYRAKQLAEQELIRNYIKKHYPGITEASDFEEYISKFKIEFKDSHDRVSVNEVIDALFKKSDKENSIFYQIMHNGIDLDSEDKFTINVKGHDVTINNTDVQMLSYIAYTQFRPYAEALSKVVQYSKIDTKKQGKNLVEQLVYQDGYNSVYNPEYSSFSTILALFDANTLHDMDMFSYIHTKTKNAIESFTSLLRPQMIEATDAFRNEIIRILNITGNSGSNNKDLISKISGAILAHIKSEYFFAQRTGYCDRHNITPKGLVSGNNTIYDRLNKLKIKLLRSEEYKDMRDAEGNIKNYLLLSIIPGYKYQYDPKLNNDSKGTKVDTYPDAKFVRLLNYIDLENLDEDEMKLAWEELLEDDTHPELQQFARDLVVYSFITSGDNGGRNDLFKFVPNSWKNKNDGGTSYSEFMSHKLAQWQSYVRLTNEEIDDIVLNNWDNGQLIPKYDIYDRNTNVANFEPYYTAGNESIPIVLKTVNKNLFEEGKTPKFIKVKRDKAVLFDGQRQYNVYKIIGSDKNGHLIYILVDVKGDHFKEKNNIYEYGRIDGVRPNDESRSIGLLDRMLVNFVSAAKKLYEEKGKDVPKLESLEDVVNFIINVINNSPNPAKSIEWMYAVAGDSGRGLADMIEGLQSVSSNIENSAILETQVTNDTITEPISNTDQTESSTTYPVPTPFDKSTAEFYSGAAKGSDTEWGDQARALGIKVKDYTPQDWDNLSEQWKDKLDREYQEVVNMLGRKVLNKYSYAGKLVRRDMMLADKADAIFAIGTIGSNGYVDGGTGYATTRGIIRGIPVYVFDQSDNQWKVWDKNTKSFIPTQEPILTNHAATIGTREINEAGKNAISSILQKTLAKSIIKPTAFPTELESKLGRISIGNSDAKYIQESISVIINNLLLDGYTLLRFLLVLNKVVDILYNSSDKYRDKFVEIPYRDWKQLLQTKLNIFHNEKSINLFENFIDNDLQNVLEDGDWVDYNSEEYLKYDKNIRTIQIPKIEYDLVELLSKNLDYLTFLMDISPQSSVSDTLTIGRDKYKDVSEMVTSLSTSVFDEGYIQEFDEEKEGISTKEFLEQQNIKIKYSYKDSRQLELFDESFFNNKVSNSTNNVQISTVGYRKGDPQQHPDTAYVFTENAQAAGKFYEDDLGYSDVDSNNTNVRLAVSDVNGTNQAGIRTDQQGNKSANVFGIVVKKKQQDSNGRWLAKEGQFEDTDQDFEMFKAFNERFFEKVKSSGLTKIVLPSQMGLGKAALPLRFAEWLQQKLQENFGVVSTIKKNERSDYEGYGLTIDSIKSQSSIQTQNSSSSEEFYIKQSVDEYVNDLVANGVSRDNIIITHTPETDTTDEYWTVEVKDDDNVEENYNSTKTLSTIDRPLLIYSDGSDIKGTGNIGYGAVFEYSGKQYGISGTETGEEVTKLKLMFPDAKFSNPTMEMLALTTILEHIANSGKAEHIEINLDYKGAVNYNGLWQYSESSNQRAEKPWNAKEPYIAHLVQRSEAAIKQIEANGGSVKIRWVKGHQTGLSDLARMNNAADAYAKNRNNFNNIDEAYSSNKTTSEQDYFNNIEEFPEDEMNHCKH